MKTKHSNVVYIYIFAIAFVALANGFSDSLLANFFKDAYNTDAAQRGFIELPREFPGVIALSIIAFLSRFGDIKIAAFAQIFSAAGILALAIWTPSFYSMTALLFIFSMGVHIYLPLQDSIPMTLLSGENNTGAVLGRFKGIYTFFTLIASVIVFFSFRYGIFTLVHEIRWVFVLAAIAFVIAGILLLILSVKISTTVSTKPKMIFRKEYKYYYILAVMNGVQKQIVLVYSPWVLIEMLNAQADTMSILLIISSICGMFFLPFLGKCLDRFGIRKMLYADALSYIGIYLAFAFMAYNLYVGNYLTTGLAVVVTFGLYIIDRMSSQMGIIRSVYLNSIARDRSEVLSTLSLGISLDHVVAITCSYICGIIWTNFGPHYIFLFTASLSIVNLIIAKIVPLKSE